MNSPFAYQNLAYDDSLLQRLISTYGFSVTEIKNYLNVSSSTIYRWLRQSDQAINHQSYKRLLSLYCSLV